MKKIVFIFALTFGILATLSACGEVSTKDPATPNDITLPPKTPTETQAQTDTPMTADSLLDSQIFSQATSSNSLEECEKILDESKRAECKEIVASSLKTQEALENSDISLCEEISLPRYKENCETRVNEKIERENENALVMERRENDEQLLNQAMDEDNLSLCDEITDENQRGSCKFNILANKARSENTPELCKEIGEDSLIELCESFF